MSQDKKDLAFYYKIGDTVVTSQLEANKLFHQTKQEFKFCLFEDQFNSVDWTKEPAGTWDEWSKQRALQLRHKYKKIKIHFTAGSDSSHVLRTFLDNNIFVDEIVIIDSVYNPHRHYEVENLILPLVKKLCLEHIGMKYSVVKVDKNFYDNWFKNSDWLEAKNQFAGSLLFTPNNWGLYVNEADKDSVFGKDVCHILGMEKPRLTIENGKWYFQPLDKMHEHLNPAAKQIEYFYYAPDMPEYYVKQCWIMINYVEEKMSGIINESNLSIFYNAHGPYYDDFVKACGRGKPYIYVLGNGKNKYRDVLGWPHNKMREYARNENWSSINTYTEMMDYFKKNYSYMFNNDDPYYGFVGVWGDKKFIKDFTSGTPVNQRKTPIILL